MKAIVPFSMEHDEIAAIKVACKNFDISFSAVVRLAMQNIGAINYDFSQFVKQYEGHQFVGTFEDWKKRPVSWDYKGQHLHLGPDFKEEWCSVPDCKRAKEPIRWGNARTVEQPPQEPPAV